MTSGSTLLVDTEALDPGILETDPEEGNEGSEGQERQTLPGAQGEISPDQESDRTTDQTAEIVSIAVAA